MNSGVCIGRGPHVTASHQIIKDTHLAKHGPTHLAHSDNNPTMNEIDTYIREIRTTGSKSGAGSLLVGYNKIIKYGFIIFKVIIKNILYYYIL